MSLETNDDKDKTSETEHLKLQKTGKEVFSKHWIRRKHGGNNNNRKDYIWGKEL